MSAPGITELDTLAQRVLEARAEFDAGLGGNRRRFPLGEFDQLWTAVLEYSAAMRGRNWLHRDVAREFSGFREYLELEILATPSNVLRRTDRMECILFADYDAYPEDDEPSGLETMIEEPECGLALYEGECAGCGQFRRINELALCEDCSAKIERDLVRERDWAYSVTAYGRTDEDRERLRKEVVREFGEDPELMVPTQRVKLDRKRRRNRKSK